MKITILAVTAALLATPVFAQSTVPTQGTTGADQSAVQGRSGSTAGGYTGGPASTGSTGTGTTTGSGTMSGQSGTMMPQGQQGSGTNSGNAPAVRQ